MQEELRLGDQTREGRLDKLLQKLHLQHNASLPDSVFGVARLVFAGSETIHMNGRSYKCVISYV